MQDKINKVLQKYKQKIYKIYTYYKQKYIKCINKVYKNVIRKIVKNQRYNVYLYGIFHSGEAKISASLSLCIVYNYTRHRERHCEAGQKQSSGLFLASLDKSMICRNEVNTNTMQRIDKTYTKTMQNRQCKYVGSERGGEFCFSDSFIENSFKNHDSTFFREIYLFWSEI